MCLSSSKPSAPPVIEDKVAAPEPNPTPEAPVIADERRALADASDAATSNRKGTSALRINLKLPESSGVNVPGQA